MTDEGIIKNIADRLDNIPQCEEFDKTKAFEEIIAPKLHELKCLCNQQRIPFFFTACVKGEKNKTKYKSTMISPTEFPERLHLHEDKISKCLGIMIGFDSVYPKKDLEVDIDEEINNAKTDFMKKLESEVFVEKTYLAENKKIKPNNIYIRKNCN